MCTKTCICKLTKEHDFPEKELASKFFTHTLKDLITLAKVHDSLKLDIGGDSKHPLSENWKITTGWDEKSRYRMLDEAKAKELFDAITDQKHGILTWLKLRW